MEVIAELAWTYLQWPYKIQLLEGIKRDKIEQ